LFTRPKNVGPKKRQDKKGEAKTEEANGPRRPKNIEIPEGFGEGKKKEPSDMKSGNWGRAKGKKKILVKGGKAQIECWPKGESGRREKVLEDSSEITEHLKKTGGKKNAGKEED